MFLSVWLLLLSFMFNPWALLFFVVLFCVLFVLIEFTLLIAQELPISASASRSRFFFVRVSSARFPRVFVVDGFCVRFCFLLLLFSLFFYRVTLSWNKRKEVDNFVQHFNLFSEPIHGLSFFFLVCCFFIHFVCLRALVCTKTVLAKKTKWVLNILSLFWCF